MKWEPLLYINKGISVVILTLNIFCGRLMFTTIIANIIICTIPLFAAAVCACSRALDK